jgi:putative endonuclease
MTNASHTLYIGVTSDLASRVEEHKHKLVPGFTSKYNITKLIWYEHFTNPYDAISREKQLKCWRREKKVALIRSMNPEWKDLSIDEDADRPPSTSPGQALDYARDDEEREEAQLPPTQGHVERSRDISPERPLDYARGDRGST